MATMATTPAVEDKVRGRRKRRGNEQGEEEEVGSSSRRNNSGDMVDGARQRRDGTGQEKVRTGRNGTAPSASRQRDRMETG